MKTTELFVEQVLIGFLVLLVPAFVFWNDVREFLLKKSDTSLELIATGGLLIGTAYLIGMVYDRIADTLLQHLESHGRLQFALARFKVKGEEDNGDSFEHYTVPKRDPFRDGKYRIVVLSNSQATAQMEYLRSRIRLTRAMATIIPALTVALLLAIDKERTGSVWWTIAAVTIPFVYLATLFLKVRKPKKKKQNKGKEKKNLSRAPKTYELEEVKVYMEHARMVLTEPPRKRGPRHILNLIAYDEVWIALLILAVAGATLVLSTGTYARLSVVATGLVLTIIVGWTWWRISMTFYAFVRDYATYGPRKPGA